MQNIRIDVLNIYCICKQPLSRGIGKVSPTVGEDKDPPNGTCLDLIPLSVEPLLYKPMAQVMSVH